MKILYTYSKKAAEKLLTAAIAMTAVMLTASCEYKDFIDVNSGTEIVPIKVSFNWNRVDSIPGKMQLMFYADETSSYQRFDVGKDTTVIYIAPGNYNVTAWNNDGTHVYFNGYENRLNINATTPESNPHNIAGVKNITDSILPGQKILDYPDYMVHANKKNVTVEYENDQHIIFTPDSMVIAVDVNIGGISGLEIVREVKGAIGNAAGRRYMAYSDRTTDPSIILFDARSNEADSTVTAQFWIFGMEPLELKNKEHKAMLFFWTTRGKACVVLDITNLIKRQQGENHLSIDIPNSDIDIRELVPTGGMDIDIEKWNDEYKPIGF